MFDAATDDAEPATADDRSTLALAQAEGDISALLSPAELATLGARVVEDYERDLTDRKPWADKVEAALKAAAQESSEDKDYPFPGASNVKHPILTVAALQFQARAYPAIFKGDEVVQIKVIGKDAGRPVRGPDGQPVIGPDGQPQFDVPPGSKAARAVRVKDYMNICLGYRVKDWEADTDAMLLQLPIVGCGFRKQWWDSAAGSPCAAYVPALRLVVPMATKSLDVAPRVTEEVPDVYPYQLRQRMRAGDYREVVLPTTGDDDEAPRLLLEQHRLMDLDDDGLDEPYIVTVDHETSEVLRLEANFTPADLDGDPETGVIARIKAGRFYTKYEFFPHPEGKFYSIGFGHLLAEIGAVIDTTINQMIDAGHAAIAGGGFITSGLRLQGNGQTSRLTFRPGEYKNVGSQVDIRSAIYERTFPNPSPVMFQLLDLMLAAANDIAAIKDVTSGDASNNGQVGTTLALIEQGLQVFTAIYKRLYRGLRDEFQLLYANLGTYGDARTARDYALVLDDDRADFAADFRAEDMDIRPVSDPSSVTRMQKMARAQFLFGLKGQGLDDAEIMRRVLEAADIEDADKLFPKQQGPDPLAQANLAKITGQAQQAATAADLNVAKAAQIGAQVGRELGEADAGTTDGGGLPDMARPPGQPMGVPGAPDGFGGAEGGVGPGVMGDGPGGPPAFDGIARAG